LSSCTGLVLRVKGNGKRFKFVVRDNEAYNGRAWSYSFDTDAAEFTEVKVPFAEFVPVNFNRIAGKSPEFDTSRLRVFQIVYSRYEYDGDLNPNFAAGPFSLSIKSLEAF